MNFRLEVKLLAFPPTYSGSRVAMARDASHVGGSNLTSEPRLEQRQLGEKFKSSYKVCNLGFQVKINVIIFAFFSLL